MRQRELSGKRFGRLVVLRRTDNHISPNGSVRTMWRCKCDCGSEVTVWAYSLTSGKTISCGCFQKERASEVTGERSKTHGRSKSRLYRVWRNILNRCGLQSDIAYKNYGGRGISVCEEWKDFSNFYIWAIDSGYNQEAKKGVCTIDRIDVNGNYCPENCRWATIKEQDNNKRNTHYLTFNGKTQSLALWAEEFGIKKTTLDERIKRGWSVEDALTKPVQQRTNGMVRSI